MGGCKYRVFHLDSFKGDTLFNNNGNVFRGNLGTLR